MPARNHLGSKPASRRLLGALALFSLAAVPAAQAHQTAGQAPAATPSGAATAIPAPPDTPTLPATPGAVLEVVEVHPFRLREGYRYDWMASRPLVTSGLLVVLKVDPAYVQPRDAAEPVLYAGDTTVQRLNQGDRSGYVVGIVPGEADLATALVFFGRPELPERVTGETVSAERELAERAGIQPFSSEQIGLARREAVSADDLQSLLRGQAANLVLKYSSAERDLAETWRLPTAGSPGPR